MANPLKVLTQLSASKEAQFAEVVEMQKTVTLSGAEADLIVSGGGEISGSGELKIAGASQLGSSLDVKGAAALSGSLGVVGAADLQSTLAIAGVASFQSDISGAAGFDLVGAAHIAGAVDMDSTLNVDGAASFQSNISGAAQLNIGGASHLAGAAQLDSTLDVDGAVDFDSTLDVAGNVTMQASASLAGDLDMEGNADIAGNLDVHGNAVVYGNLEVKGSMTTIESTTVTVADANIQLATVASPTDTTADGAGITVLGATNKTFQWNNDGHGFTSSENMNIASGKVYKLNGSEVIGHHAGGVMFSAGNDGSAHVQVLDDNKISIFTANSENNALALNTNGGIEAFAATKITLDAPYIDIDGDLSGSAGFDLVGAANLQSTLAVAGVASFAADITASAGLDVAGDVNIGINSKYKVGQNILAQYVSANNEMVLGLDEVSGNPAASVHLQATQVGIVNGDASTYLNVGDAGIDLQTSADIAIQAATGISLNPGSDQEVTLSSRLRVGSSLNVDDYNGLISIDAPVTASSAVQFGTTVNVVGAVDMDSTLNVDGQADFQAAANFHDDVAMDAALNLSGSDFVNIATPVTSGKYNVNDAIRALDAGLGTQGSNINSAYAALRFLETKNFDANGMAYFTASNFPIAAIEQVTVDVLVQPSGSSFWANDLLSVQVKAAGSFVGFEVSAPAMGANDKVRLIAVKESGSLA